MYGGRSGCHGIIVYNTKKEGKNAVYGYYTGNEMCFETGTVDELTEFRKAQESGLDIEESITVKKVIVSFLAALAIIIAGYIFLPPRIAIALMVFCILSYMPLMIIYGANTGLYINEEQREAFCRFHGCEHAILITLTKEKDCTMEELKKGRIYDTECGTAYSGYILLMALVLSLLIILGIGFLKSAAVLILTLIIIITMILIPAINPFTVFQHHVVAQPTEREYRLGLEIMKKMKEL